MTSSRNHPTHHKSPDHDKKEPSVLENVPLAPFTTLGLGGEARYLVSCVSEDDIRFALGFARRHRLPVYVLGGGSNTIFPDGGFPGLVLRVDTSGFWFRESGADLHLTVGAGEEWDELVRLCVRNGYTGVEALSGIPGCVGAVPVQNVGAYGCDVSQSILSVRALHRGTGKTRLFAAEECGFSYRDSCFKSGEERGEYIITRVAFRLSPGAPPRILYPELAKKLESEGEGGTDAPTLARVREAVLELRRGKSMVVDPLDPDSRSAGSFFLNPLLSTEEFRALKRRAGGDLPSFESDGYHKVPAAWLVEHAGFKRGYRKGGVGVSSKHSLALVNYDGSTKELMELAEAIRAGVREKFGVTLEREPVLAEPSEDSSMYRD